VLEALTTVLYHHWDVDLFGDGGNNALDILEYDAELVMVVLVRSRTSRWFSILTLWHFTALSRAWMILLSSVILVCCTMSVVFRELHIASLFSDPMTSCGEA